MIQELLYTSHEGRGLRQGGGGGFCTVLSTTGMATNLAAALEKLSGYKHPFDIHDPRSRQNPVNYRHAVIRVGGVTYHVLSRIADLQREHTGRSNKLAHHVVLTEADLMPGGPTRVLSQPGFCRTDWDGKVTLVEPVDRKTLPADELPVGVCKTWAAIAGDAGWAGHVADKLLAGRDAIVSVIFPLGANCLTLANEIFSLLPPERRWMVTFSTYYAAAPPISTCHLRFVLDGTADADLLRRDYRQTVVDLAAPSQALAETPLVIAARNGDQRQNLTASASNNDRAIDGHAQSVPEPSVVNLAPLVDRKVDEDEIELLPPVVRRSRTRRESNAPAMMNSGASSPQRKSLKAPITAAVILGLTLLLVLSAVVVVRSLRSPTSPSVLGPTAANMNERESAPPTPHVSTDKDGDSPPPSPGQASDPTPLPLDDESTHIVANASVPDPLLQQENVNTVPAPAAESQPPTLLDGPLLPMLDPQQTTLAHISTLASTPVQFVSDLGPVTDCRLVGFDWIASRWLSYVREGLECKTMAGSRGLSIETTPIDKSLLARKPSEICAFSFDNRRIEFSWTDDALRRVNGSPEKAALLNALRWCILEVRRGEATEYYRLSLPFPRKDFAIFALEPAASHLLPTVLPVSAEAGAVSTLAPVPKLVVSASDDSGAEHAQSAPGCVRVDLLRSQDTEDYVEVSLCIQEDPRRGGCYVSASQVCFYRVPDSLEGERLIRGRRESIEMKYPYSNIVSTLEVRLDRLGKDLDRQTQVQETKISTLEQMDKGQDPKRAETLEQQLAQLKSFIPYLENRKSQVSAFKDNINSLIKRKPTATFRVHLTYMVGSGSPLVLPVMSE